MSKPVHGRAITGILLGSALAAAAVLQRAHAETSHAVQAFVLASRNPSSGLGEFHPLHRQMRHQRVVRRHFRGPRVIGVENGAAEVPVPVPLPQSDEENFYPVAPPYGGFGYRPYPPPPLVAPPQIITLPNMHSGPRKLSPAQATAHAPIIHRKVVEIHRRTTRYRVARYRIFTWPAAYAFWPYTGALVPITFAPCDDPAHSAIYNTPCGVRPFE